MLRASGVDERTFLWEGSAPTFLVTLFDSARSTDTYALTDCGVLDAIRWAQDNVAPNGAWSVGLVDTRHVPGTGDYEIGFTYLEGFDLNSNPHGLSDWEGRQLDEMLSRGHQRVVLPATSSTVFPNRSAATAPEAGGSVTWTSD